MPLFLGQEGQLVVGLPHVQHFPCCAFRGIHGSLLFSLG